jgi:hypothetical protein
MNRFRLRSGIFISIGIVTFSLGCAASELIFPQIANGHGYRSILLLTNRSATPTTAKVEFTNPGGAPLSLPINTANSSKYEVQLAAFGSARLQTNGGDSDVAVGWARVTTSPVAEIDGNAVFQAWHGDFLIAESAVPASRPTTSVVFYADEDAGTKTGLAIANPGSGRAIGLLTLRNPAGNAISTAPIELTAGGQQSRYLSELLNPTQTGRVEISMQSGSIAVTALHLIDAVMTSVAISTPSPTIVSGSCSDIQTAIDNLPSQGGEITILAGTYTCNMPLLINRDNVSLTGQGAGTILRLAEGANAPLMVIGETFTPPALIRRNIKVANLMLDGNKTAQTFECWGGPCDSGGLTAIRNNGITLRKVEDVTIENVTAKNSRSGGLVTEKNCRRLTIKGFTAFENYYDGLAGYETEESIFSDLYLHDNLAAGISLDINFNNNVLSNGALIANHKLGIFMRNSRNNTFSSFQIRKSGEHGVFLAQVDNDMTKPAAGNSFNGLVIADSGTVYSDNPYSGQSSASGIRINDASCIRNILCNSQMTDNKGGGISEAAAGLLQICGNAIN